MLTIRCGAACIGVSVASGRNRSLVRTSAASAQAEQQRPRRGISAGQGKGVYQAWQIPTFQQRPPVLLPAGAVLYPSGTTPYNVPAAARLVIF